MAKRFTDTGKYRKPFIRSLTGAYKLLWDYLYHDCDHAGIWTVDFDIAQICIGKDMPVNKEDALKYFNEDKERIVEIENGKKWFIVPFIKIQYNTLSEGNTTHDSVINILKKYDLISKLKETPIKPLPKGLDRDKDKDKDKEGVVRGSLDEELIKKINIVPDFQKTFLRWLQYKRKRRESYKTEESTFLAYKKLYKFSEGDLHKAKQIIEQSMSNNWAGLFELKEESKKMVRNNHPRFYDDQNIPYDWNEEKQMYVSPGGNEWYGAPLKN
jgi:hypothetical protein